MTDQELQQLAKRYAEELFPEHCALMEKGECDFETEEVIKGCISAFESHVHYLMQDYCIVSREKVRELYHQANCDYCNDPDTVNTLESIFGKSTLEKL